MSFWFGVGLSSFRRWLERKPFAAERVETLFWIACILFVAVIMAAWLLMQWHSPGDR